MEGNSPCFKEVTIYGPELVHREDNGKTLIGSRELWIKPMDETKTGWPVRGGRCQGDW